MPLVPSDYLTLPTNLYQAAAPSAGREPVLRAFNHPLADALAIETTGDDERARLFGGLDVPEGLTPVSLAYAGHQFGHFVPQLGDGRAIVIGTAASAAGPRFDVQLKGAGRTPFSRNGDGRSSLGPVVREYLVSEAMHALGVPTTRALAAVTTGETVLREDRLPGAILTRVATSHIRVGTFEFLAARGMHDDLMALVDHAIARHDPDLADAPDRTLRFFERVVERTVQLVARWMGLGFIHGVMNTDNTAVSGETLDYGPCAFMDTFRWDQVYSSIDHRGRYRYRAQPSIAAWNLSILAGTLVPLIDDDESKAIAALEAVLDTLEGRFQAAWVGVFGPKLGLGTPEAADADLARDWLDHLEAQSLDFTNAFRGLDPEGTEDSAFHRAWRERLAVQGDAPDAVRARMREHNPAFIPRNHLVERAIQATLREDWSVFEQLHTLWQRPFDEQPGNEAFREPPAPKEIVHQTFCGT